LLSIAISYSYRYLKILFEEVPFSLYAAENVDNYERPLLFNWE